MSVLQVGPNQSFTTIAAAVNASASGDTVDVTAGTYTNDFLSITHDLTLNAIGGTVRLVATQQPPNGKAAIDEGGPGVNVTIRGFDISGVTVPDTNGAAIRYEGGNLVLTDSNFHDNQEGILAANDPNGTILIDRSSFSNNGLGDGYTHNIYINGLASLTVQNSSFTNANGGHDIKSRASSTTILNNTIADNASGLASYQIDVPNGGQVLIAGNYIQKGPLANNPVAISFGEDGAYAGSSLVVRDNTIVNDFTAHSTAVVANHTDVVAQVTANSLFGWTAVASGLAAVAGTVNLLTAPLQALGAIGGALTSNPVTVPAAADTPAPVVDSPVPVTVPATPDPVTVPATPDPTPTPETTAAPTPVISSDTLGLPADAGFIPPTDPVNASAPPADTLPVAAAPVPFAGNFAALFAAAVAAGFRLDPSVVGYAPAAYSTDTTPQWGQLADYSARF